jgi:hypothetical protein
MKKFLTKTFSSKPMTVCGVLFILIAATRLANADPLKEARVSQVIQDVRLLEAHGAPHPAAVNDKVTLGSAVRTGVESRAELTFNDLTITRVGANTIFSFTAGARQAELTQGAILLQVRPGAPPVRANTTAVTVAVTGGTALLSTGPPTKFMVLEGTGTIYPLGHPEKAVTVHGGEMVIAEDGRLSKPEEFDVKLVLETSLLILDFPPLANLPLIQAVVDQQQAEQLVMIWNPPPYKSFFDVIDVTDLNANSNPAVIEVRLGTPTPTPAPPPPTPSKFGTPSTITSPNPYVITSGTTITTDPAITTNGVTDFGKIYRGPMDDGAFSLWAFGSTSAVDTALDFDTHFNSAGHFPGAVFKFASLQLAGNPTIDLSNGGYPNLALISVGDITSGLPGGTLTFSGLDALLLASQDGSINLGSEITFQNIPTLFFYARGTNGNLTLASPIIGTTDLFLYAGRNITFNGGTNLIVGDQFSARSAGGNISVSESGNISVGGSLFATTDVIASTATGGNITLTTGGPFSASTIDITTTVEPGITLTNGANIALNIGMDLTVNGGGALSLLIANNDGGHIGTGGNISVTTGGDLTANSINAFINNRNGGSITSGANLIFNVGGALSTTGDATFVISNRNDSGGGGTIGGDVNLTFSAASISVGGILVTDVSANRGGHIIGSAHNSVNAAGLLSGGTLDFEIENAGYDDGGGFAPGGTIDSDAILSVTASDISTTSDYFNALIWNAGGGHIGGNAVLNISASNGLTSGGDAYFSIINSPNGDGTPAGTIGGNATIQANIGSMSVGGLLDVVIDNTEGSIGGNATVNMNVAGSANVTNDATVAIYGSDGADSSAININGGSYNVGGTFLTYIDGNGTITFNNATAHADVLKAGVFGANGVLNVGGGILSADSELKLYAPGSNGQLNFVSNVTLGGSSLKILAANSVTIFDNVVVTIGGPNRADVYVNFVGGVPNANYSEEWGGNGNTTGTFAGAGANNPQPLDQAPPFGASPPSRARRGNITRDVINVSNTAELLALLDGAAVGPNGRITISDSNSKRNLRNLSRINMNSLQRRERRMLFHEMRERSNMRRLGAQRIL